MKKVLMNSFYRIIYQLLTILLPIISIPIVSNSLGPSGIGTYKYLFSIASYFVLVAGLGLGMYGSRTIATARDSKAQLSKTFWEIEFGSMLVSGVTFLVYVIIGLILKQDMYYFILSLTIIASLLDIHWLYMGIEDFKIVTLISMLVKTLSFLAIVLLIRSQSDLFIYFLIQVSSILFTNIFQWIFVRKYITFTRVETRNIFFRIGESAKFFPALLASNLYQSIATTLLGMITTTVIVGYYSNTISIISITFNIIVALDWVLLPRMSNIAKTGGEKSILTILQQTIHLQIFLTIPLMFGLVSVSQSLVPWFFGDKFSFISQILPFFTVLCIIQPLGSAILNQYLIPLGRMKIYNGSIAVGALVSVTLNLLLIPLLGIWGALIAVIAAESAVTGLRVRYLLRNSSFQFEWGLIVRFFISGFLMLIIIRIITADFPPTIITTLIQALIGVISYLLITFVLKANYVLSFIRNQRNK